MTKITCMAQSFLVGYSMIAGRDGELFSPTPVVPLRINAEDATDALLVFAERASGTILETRQGHEPALIDAKVSVDGRVLRVRVTQ